MVFHLQMKNKFFPPEVYNNTEIVFSPFWIINDYMFKTNEHFQDVNFMFTRFDYGQITIDNSTIELYWIFMFISNNLYHYWVKQKDW